MLSPCTTSTHVSVPGSRRRQSGGISATIRSRSDAFSPESTGPVTALSPAASAPPLLAAPAASVEAAAAPESLDLV